ncbi:TonB-dependent receptor [Sphingomonas nostoxanthinifaciens]|uniref:TonB-dependent receptor n=1 Tax=Sphingomonas nostoxanthinifaciens TaxID=2872652 RepID=UPI001CC1D193|nr:TonB-dependent receptor [Sphingomonas nostoxanthinifaciens]UAK22877.1 TonB-dependent receptor [Sphingomonas nostoxanthinifaciens]
MRRPIGSTTFSLAVALAAAATCAPAYGQTAAFDREASFAIPAGDLRASLSQFSRTTGVQVVVAPDAAEGKRSAAVSGTHGARQALDLMLRGTGLAAAIEGDVAVLRPDPTQRRRAPVAAASTAAELSAGIGPESGQTAGSPDEILVQGYRESLRLAQDYKRNAIGSEDDILAQDIASFPDLNLAESLQRIPGVTINRDSGEGRQITLRGLGADFTRTQLNGMEVLGNTASGMDNRGGVSRTRSFDFSLFASELFNRVSVQKSYAADQDEGGIAGTVQLYTAKPFDYSGAKFVVSAQGQTNTNTSGVTPRVVALASDRWGDFGALISVAYSQIKSNEYGYRNWGWGQVKYNPANIGPNIDPATRALLQSGTIYAPQAESPSTWYTDRKRLGVTGALQYHPGAFKIDLDLLYGRLWDHRDDYAIAAAGSNALTGSPIGGTQVIQSATIVGNTLEAGSYTGVDQRSEHHVVENHTDFYQAVLNSSWQATDRLKFSALGGYEQSNFRQPVFDKVFMESKNHGFSFDNRPTEPVNSYGFDVTDPGQWQLMRLDTQENAITNKYANGKLSGDYKLSDTSHFEAGGEYKHFTNSGYTYTNKVFHNVPNDTVIPDNLKEVIGRDSQIPYIVGNIDGIYSLIGDPRNLNASYLTAGSDYRVAEETWAGYAQYDLDTLVFGMRLRANAGVRYYSTDLTSSGHLATVVSGATVLQPVSITTNSHGWLPAANFALSLTHELIARVSVNRNVNRPALSDLAAAGTLTTRPNGGSASFGNPFLKPYKATSAEGGLEYYMDRNGFASLSFFYKSMDSFTTSTTKQIPYSQTGLPLSLLVQGEDGNTLFDVSQPINGPGASIKGVEAGLQHDFTFLPGALRHLGINANGTWFDGHQSAIINGVTVRIPLFNLSKWAANATLYYDTDRWGARISTAYRSRYLTSAGSGGNVGDGIRATNNVDAQAHLNINSHLRLVVDAINITNQPIQQFADLTANRTEVYTTSGRTFTFGVTAEF